MKQGGYLNKQQRERFGTDDRFVTWLVPLDLEGDWSSGPLSRGSVPIRLDFEQQGDEVTAVAVVAGVLDDEWLLRIEVVPNGSEPQFGRIELAPVDGAGVTGARVLRRLGFGEVVDEASRWLTEEGVRHFLGDRWCKPLPRPGRRGREDVVYARWAKRYVEALAETEGKGDNPIQHILDTIDDPQITTAQQVRWYLTEARKRGLLTAAPRGRAGGELTDKARAELALHGED